MPSPLGPLPASPAGSGHVDRLAILQIERSQFRSDSTAMAMLEAMPGPAMVLDARRHVLLFNRRLRELLSLTDADIADLALPGDVFDCRNAASGAGKCGTTEACQVCGAHRAIRACLVGHSGSAHECRLATRHGLQGGAFDFRAHAAPVDIGGTTFIILALEDISGEKRRLVLERTFFHDLMNTCGGVQGLAEILAEPNNDETSELELKQDLRRLAGHAIDQIASQRALLAAERGELAVEVREFDVRNFLVELAALYRHHEVAQGKRIQVEVQSNGRIETDPTLLGRVVGNLIKNALEASRAGGTVAIRAENLSSQTVISVHNFGVIPREVQLQLFQRSFSTKGGQGRGVGTYSVRLFTEQYLGGELKFESTDEVGTSFILVVPNRLPRSAEAA